MERVSITIGPLTFDRASYDGESDVLYPRWRSAVRRG
jgi:hypothetical protein